MTTHKLLTALVLAGALVGTSSRPAQAQQRDFDRAMADVSRAMAEAGRAISSATRSIGAHMRDEFGDAQSLKVTEKFSKTVPLARGGTLDLSNISGNITITAGAGDQVVIDATKRGRTAEDLKEVSIDVTATANRVEVRTRYPETRRNIAVHVDYVVTVPKGTGASIKSVSGDGVVTGVDGELNTNTVSGDVKITGAADVRSARSVSGDVTLNNVSSTGTCSVKTISGDLSVNGLNAKDVQVDTVSGDMKLTNVVTSHATLKSISGDVHFSGPLAKGGRYEMAAHSGDITFQTGDKVGFELTASSFSGSISTGIALTTEDLSQSAADHRGPRRHTLKGRLGDSSAVLQLTSFSGDIRIVKEGAAAPAPKK